MYCYCLSVLSNLTHHQNIISYYINKSKGTKKLHALKKEVKINNKDLIKPNKTKEKRNANKK